MHRECFRLLFLSNIKINFKHPYKYYTTFPCRVQCEKDIKNENIFDFSLFILYRECPSIKNINYMPTTRVITI